MLNEDSIKVREFVKSQYASYVADITIQQAREGMEKAVSQMPVLEGAQVEVVNTGGVKSEWVSMPGSASDRVLLYLHGGAYAMGSPRTHRDTAARLSKASGARVLLPEYRLAPENPYPAALEDTLAVYRWLLNNGFKPTQIAIGGDSAGGGLSLATLISLRDSHTPLPAATILLSPWADLTFSGNSMTTRAKVDPVMRMKSAYEYAGYYAGDYDPATPLISLVFADLRGLPPMLIHVGDDEVLLDDAVRVAEHAQAAGVEVELKVWEGMWHVFQAYALLLIEARQSLTELGAFVKHHLFQTHPQYAGTTDAAQASL